MEKSALINVDLDGGSSSTVSNSVMKGDSVEQMFKYLEETKSPEEKRLFQQIGETQMYAQPAYGVQPPVYAQPAYGVQPPVYAQPAYGVQPPVFGQPAYGVQLADLSISADEMRENIATLDSAIKTLNNAWEKETESLTKQLSSSWAGKDCSEYITKLSKMDKKVENSIKALELLKNTYQKALDLILEKQKNSVDAITNVE